MKLRTYKRITNICFWIVIAAALLFDRAGTYSWLAASAAAAAVVVAGAAYFYNQRHPTQQEAPLTTAPKEDLRLAAEDQRVKDVFSSDVYPKDAEDQDIPSLWLTKYFAVPAKGSQSYGIHPSKRSFDPGTIVRIIHELSVSPGSVEYDFILTPEGNLTIRSSTRGEPTSHYYEELLLSFQERETRTPPQRLQ